MTTSTIRYEDSRSGVRQFITDNVDLAPFTRQKAADITNEQIQPDPVVESTWLVTFAETKEGLIIYLRGSNMAWGVEGPADFESCELR